MNLKRIFVDTNTCQGLWTILYPENGIAEFTRLIAKWKDKEFVTEYLITNEVYLQNEYFKGLDVDAVIDKVIIEAKSLYKYLKDFTYNSFEGGESLETIFKVLDNRESQVREIQGWKYRSDKRTFSKSILRLYAVRIGQNTFAITGGAIKIVEKMSQHPDLLKEKLKVERVVSFLKENGVNDSESFECYINEI